MEELALRRYLLQLLTPLHIGDGAMRIGPVDNTVIRRSGSREPYVPGTTLLGNYSQFCYQWAQTRCPDLLRQEQENLPYREAVNADGARHHLTGYQFLFALERRPEASEIEFHREKLFRVSDAEILWMPCMTLKGPKLITTVNRFCRVFGTVDFPEFAEDELLTHEDNLFNDGRLRGGKDNECDWLNLRNLKITANRQSWQRHSDLQRAIADKLPPQWQENKTAGLLVFLAEEVFSHLLSKNVEIRTSVAIDPVTGAGADGALFTYESLPRGTTLYFEVAVCHLCAAPYQPPLAGGLTQTGSDGVWEVLAKARPYFRWVGIGGMTSRGFGKCDIVDLPE